MIDQEQDLSRGEGGRAVGADRDHAAPHTRTSERRRFLRGTAAGSIVAMTVLGRPAWAAHCSYSGQMSGNLSAQPHEDCGGEGYSYEYWRRYWSEWHELWPPSMPWVSAFGVDAFPGRTLGDVIMGNTGLSVPTHGTEQYVKACSGLGLETAAALQNAATPVSYLLTVAEVIDSFAQAHLSGDVRQMELTMNSFEQLNSLSA